MTLPHFTAPQINQIDILYRATWAKWGLRPTLVSCRPDGTLVCYEVPRPDHPRPSFVWVDDKGEVVRDDW